MFTYAFTYFVVVFQRKICIFIIFISFYGVVSNFGNRVLTNKKLELLTRNCQWNHMNMLVGSNLSSSNLKMGEVILRLPMMTLFTFWILVTFKLYTQPKSTIAVLLQLSIISGY